MEPNWIAFIRILSRTEGFTALKVLSDQLDLSERNLKKLIKRNEASGRENGFHLEHTSLGVRLCIDDNRRFLLFLQESEAQMDTVRSRMDYILSRLVQTDGYVRIEELADELYVSRATIDRMMAEIKDAAGEYELRVVSRPKYGIRLEGPQVGKRLCYARHAAGERRLGQEITTRVQAILSEKLEDSGMTLNDAGFSNLVYHCAIAVRRILKGNQLDGDADLRLDGEYQKEYALAREIARSFETDFHISVAENEVYYITMHLLGKKVMENMRAVCPEIIDLTDRILATVRERRGIDFSGDEELKTMLALHLQPMLARLRFGMKQENPMLDQIRTQMNRAHELALYASRTIEDRTGLLMNEDEAGYLALYFALALEKRENSKGRRKLVLVCASGRGTSKLLQYKLKRRYGFADEDLILASAFELGRMDLSRCACILTTIPLEGSFEVPAILIDVSLSESSLEKVDSFVYKTPAATGRSDENTIRDRLIFLNQEFRRPEEAIRFLCDAAQKEYGLSPAFTESVLKREELSSTDVGNLVAMPHPFDYDVDGPVFALMTLKKNIRWKRGPVRLILLLALPKRETEESAWLNDMAAELCCDMERISRILEAVAPKEVRVCLSGEEV